MRKPTLGTAGRSSRTGAQDGLLFNSVPTDIPDWGIWFANDRNTGQARLAADFYRLVAQTVTPSTIETTGHSLGGALAGFVASLYGRKGTLFDNIGFEGADEPAPHGNGDDGRGDGRAPGGSRILFRQQPRRARRAGLGTTSTKKIRWPKDLEARSFPWIARDPEGCEQRGASIPAGRTRFPAPVRFRLSYELETRDVSR